MQSAPRKTLALAALLVGFIATGEARTEVAPTTPVAQRNALVDARTLARAHAGAKVMQIAGSSMHPFFGDGAVVVVKPIDESALRAGMVVVYRNRFGETIAHRLIARQDAGWVAQGYNNQQADSTLVTSQNLLGVVYATFHTIGRSVPEERLATASIAVEVALAAPAK